MELKDIITISLAVILALILVFLIFSTKRVNEITETNIKYTPPTLQHFEDRYAPIVYEAFYIKRLPENNNIWQFKKVEHNPFLQDLQSHRINYLMIQGQFYKAEFVGEGPTFFNVHLVNKCISEDEKYFKSCQNVAGVGSMSIVHVLGYNFDI